MDFLPAAFVSAVHRRIDGLFNNSRSFGDEVARYDADDICLVMATSWILNLETEFSTVIIVFTGRLCGDSHRHTLSNVAQPYGTSMRLVILADPQPGK